jgi:hypothetical protein
LLDGFLQAAAIKPRQVFLSTYSLLLFRLAYQPVQVLNLLLQPVPQPERRIHIRHWFLPIKTLSPF